MSPSNRDRGPDDDTDPEKPEWVDDFFRQLRKERGMAQGSLISYNESNEHVARSIILWAAGIASALLVAGILGGLSLSNQLAVTTQKVTTLEIQAQQRSQEHHDQLQEVKTEVQGLRQDVQRLADQRH